MASSHPDVIVIGAGLIGCAIAHSLARTGRSVVVLDANLPGSGASQASAGMLCPHIEGAHDPVLQQLGADSLNRYDAFIARVTRDSDLQVPYVRDGTLQVADTDEQAARLQEIAGDLHARGVGCHFLDGPAAVLEAEPLALPRRAGLLIEAHGAVRIRDLVEALRLGALHHGARFLHSERVEQVMARPDGLEVRTHVNTFQAPHTVVTAGAWSLQLPVVSHPPIPTHPVRGQLLRLQVPGANVRRVLWCGHCYMVPWGDELLVGATMEEAGFDARATVAGVTHLCTAAQAVIPDLAQATFSEVRVGLRPGSPDGLPIVGVSSIAPGLIYATGHFRNGALLAPLTADVVTDLISAGAAAAIPPAMNAARFNL